MTTSYVTDEAARGYFSFQRHSLIFAAKSPVLDSQCLDREVVRLETDIRCTTVHHKRRERQIAKIHSLERIDRT